MSTFPLKIVTPDGPVFDGEAQRIIVRTTGGDMAVLARHMNCVTSLGTGPAIVVDAAGRRRSAACMGGILCVHSGTVSLIPMFFQWAESIDATQAQRDLEQAEHVLNSPNTAPTDRQMAQSRLRRAQLLVRMASEGK